MFQICESYVTGVGCLTTKGSARPGVSIATSVGALNHAPTYPRHASRRFSIRPMTTLSVTPSTDRISTPANSLSRS